MLAEREAEVAALKARLSEPLRQQDPPTTVSDGHAVFSCAVSPSPSVCMNILSLYISSLSLPQLTRHRDGADSPPWNAASDGNLRQQPQQCSLPTAAADAPAPDSSRRRRGQAPLVEPYSGENPLDMQLEEWILTLEQAGEWKKEWILTHEQAGG